MCRLLTVIYVAVCILGIGGCEKPTDPKTKARIDVAKGEQDLEKSKEQQELQDSTAEDDDKMTEATSPDEDFEQAIAAFGRAIELDPKSADAYAEIAQILGVSSKTIETHRSQLMARLQIHDVTGIVRYAVRMGLVSSDR